MEVYNTEQMEKARILDVLISNYNDGRKKTLFCVAVNLLELQELQAVLREIECKSDMEALSLKEKSAFVASLLQDTASRRKIDLKLHKKSANKKSRENLQKKEKNEVIEKGYNKLGHHLSAGLEEISNDAYAGDSGVDSVGFSSLARYSFTLP